MLRIFSASKRVILPTVHRSEFYALHTTCHRYRASLMLPILYSQQHSDEIHICIISHFAALFWIELLSYCRLWQAPPRTPMARITCRSLEDRIPLVLSITAITKYLLGFITLPKKNASTIMTGGHCGRMIATFAAFWHLSRPWLIGMYCFG